jgi:hypothetical protein
MPKSSAVAKKIAPHPRTKNRIREVEQLYLLREWPNSPLRLPTAGVAESDHNLHVLKPQPIDSDVMRRYVPVPANGHYGHVERDFLFQRYADKLLVNSRLTRRVVSFQASKRRPFYRWLKYKEAFSFGTRRLFIRSRKTPPKQSHSRTRSFRWNGYGPDARRRTPMECYRNRAVANRCILTESPICR